MHNEKKKVAVQRKNWRIWCAVVLMLVAVLMYVLTLDDSVIPVFFK